MRLAGETVCRASCKTANLRFGLVLQSLCFLFLFILISPLYAEPSPEPQHDKLFFLEELFVFEDAFSFFESLMGEKTPPDKETFPNEEIFPEPQPSIATPEWSVPDEEFRYGEETSLNEEPFLSEKISSDEETILSEEILPDEETILSEEILPDEETLLAEDPFLDENDFFFEAPPLIFEVPTFEIRSLDVIFPNFSQEQKIMTMSNVGLRHSFMKGESPTLIPNPDLGIDLLGSIMKKKPSHLIEALAVVPYNERELDLLDIYNALGRIEKIKDCPVSLNGNDYYLFTESTRIESARNRKAISDPLPSVTLPFSETMYLRLKEINFGNLFIRADVSISMYGITYSMTNFTDVRYFLIPIVRTEGFITIIYLEPVKEGILIYSMTGFYLPGFIADKVNLTPNINRRIEIFIKWITEGLRKQESAANE